jgi:ribosomal protein S12 methylthiotransferase accessory factor
MTMISPVDSRTGLIRWLGHLPIEPGEPRIFNSYVKMAATERYSAVHTYDRCGGAGWTADAAAGAAIGEGLERYCSSICFDEQLVFGPADRLLDSYELASPTTFALFHEQQETPFPRFRSDTYIAWTLAETSGSNRALVPACLVYMPYRRRTRNEDGECLIGPAISTGLACARTREQAIEKGLCEVIERDAFTIRWLNHLPCLQVDITRSSELRELYRSRLARPGLEFLLFDFSLDLPISVFVSVTMDYRYDPVLIAAGGAAALDPTRAAQKALLEAAQTREWAKILRRQIDAGIADAPSRVPKNFEEHVALYACQDMTPELRFLVSEGSHVTLQDAVTYKGPERPETARQLLSWIEHLGMRVFVVDLTTPDVRQSGYWVVKVLVPTLHPLHGDHRYPFLGGQRLYEVPHLLGLASPRGPEDLSVVPHPYP